MRLTCLCFAKESKQRNATLVSASLRFASGSLRCSVQPGSRANSPAAQTSTIPDPSGPALLGADTRVGAGLPNTQAAGQPNNQTTKAVDADKHGGCALAPDSEPQPDPDSPVVAGPVMGSKSGIRAAHCLSATQWSEFGRTPAFWLQRRLPVAQRRVPDTRVAFSLLTFFWRSKRQVSSRRATPGQQTSAKPTRPFTTTT